MSKGKEKPPPGSRPEGVVSEEGSGVTLKTVMSFEGDSGAVNRKRSVKAGGIDLMGIARYPVIYDDARRSRSVPGSSTSIQLKNEE